MLEKEMDIGPIRPPSEGGSHSLLIRATRNCPWNRCTFCAFNYKGNKFQLRPLEEIIKDIDIVKGIKETTSGVSEKLGYGGELNSHVLETLLNNHLGATSSPTFVTVINWLASGGKTVFLQDADSLIMKTPELIEILNYLKASFPSIERITSYARAKTAYKKSAENLKALKEAGLSRLHVGLETGDDYLLKKVKKGITAQEHIEAGKKVVNAGIELSSYVIPGLGGLDLSMDHANNTALVLNEINPHYIRSRPFVPRRGSLLFEEYESGEFRLLSPHGIISEIGMMVNALNVTSRLCFDHAVNASYRSDEGLVSLFDQRYEGYQLPDKKEEILLLIAEGLKVEESKYIRAENLIDAML